MCDGEGANGTGKARCDVTDRKQCRRCSECSNSEHHWMERCVFDASDELYATHVCKHCEILGFECQECGGDGKHDSGGFTPWGEPIDLPCESCQSHGVIVIPESEVRHEQV